MDYKKIAKIFQKKDSTLLIWRTGQNEYWISNAYFAVKVDKHTFCKFKSKYSSYAKKPYIEYLEVGEDLNIYDEYISDRKAPDINNVLDDSNAKKAIVTKFFLDLVKEPAVVYIADKKFNLVSKEYIDIFGYNNKFKSAGILNPLFVYKEDEMIGLIMPLRNGFDGYESEFNLLKEAL